MSNNAKRKGSAFERKISKILSEKFKSHTGIDQSFRRNIDSGSYFGGSNQKRVDVYDTSKATFGDIICPSGFKFNPECKHYKSPPSFNVLFTQEYKQWNTWIDQAKQDATNSGQKMLLIIKYNGIDEFVIVEDEYSIKPTFKYKEYFAYSLEEFLTLDISTFF